MTDGTHEQVPGGSVEPPSGIEATVVFGAVPRDTAPSTPPADATATLGTEDQAAIAALPADCALLIVQRGPGAGARFLLDSDRILVGRSERSDIFLDDVTVSRKHASFVRAGGEFSVRDSGSLNGTYVNRERVDAAVLRSGDEVQVGKFRMVFFPSRRAAGSGQ